MLDASLSVRAVLASATAFMAKRQSNRIKRSLRALLARKPKRRSGPLGPLSMFPESLGGATLVCLPNEVKVDLQS